MDDAQPLAGAYQAFLRDFPEYASTAVLDKLRTSDYARLDAGGHAYLDYTGSGLYAESHVAEHAKLLREGVFGNPHSASLTSSATTALVERARQAVLAFFGAPEEQYTAIFTANASAALKLIGESYPFAPGGSYLAAVDNHNSVNGIREFAQSRGATVHYAPLTVPELRIDHDRLDSLLADADRRHANLFAYPAQSNFSGVKHSLDLIDRAHAHGWDVLLDAAAFVPTNRLDLSTARPEFVAVSFYKMFGYPTGVGCLIARTTALERLRRPWFAGGTVNFATVQGRGHILTSGEAGFEDGTINFLGIPAVEAGLHNLDTIGFDVICTRVRCLTDWTLQRLLSLAHANGRHMVRLYGPTTTEMRGGTIAFNLYDPDGHLLDYRRIETLATDQRLSLRTGCFCNPGVGETAEGLTVEDMQAGMEHGKAMTLPRFVQIIQHRGGKSAGAIRASLGLVSNFRDVHRFVTFVEGIRNQTRLTIREVTFDVDAHRAIRDGS